MSSPSNPQPTAVVVENVSKLFGRFAALREVSCTFESGKLFGLFGDNGAGKSTLLRVIAGLARPTRGRVSIFGSDDARSAASDFGYMAHAALLYDELSGMENLRYFARLYDICDDAVCLNAMREVGLDPDLQRRIAQYSQGMRQRLSLARAILHAPRLLLLDEPFSNVDVPSAQHMAEVLGRFRDAGKTILVITHQPAVLENVADESIAMSAGKIISRQRGIAAAAQAGHRIGVPA